MRICNHYNDYSCITQLRSWLPPDIGNVMWIAQRYPCFQPYIPWYYGIISLSAEYEKRTYTDALKYYNIKDEDYRALYPDHACWVFSDFAAKVDSSYAKEVISIKQWKNTVEKDIFKTIKEREREIADLYKSDPHKAREMLTNISKDYAKKVLNETKARLY